MLSARIRSNKRQIAGVMLMGRSFEASEASPFLYTGVMSADFQSEGHVQVSSDCQKR